MEFTNENIAQLLSNAIQNKRIKVFYQPKFESLSCTLVGAEALARWLDDDGTIIQPSQFIPPLEETEKIIDLDWYVLEETCILLHKNIELGIPVVTISVNFSRFHIREPFFIEKLNSIVNKYGLSRSLIEVEITESAMNHHKNNIIEFISNIRNEGYSVSIDDFGSGYSSLSFLKDVPANILKIDKSLLSSNCKNKKERIVLESVFNFAHRLKLTTVAEGVETKEQLGFLRTCDCNIIQGFIFAKPLEEEIFTELCMTVETIRNTEDFIRVQSKATTNNMIMDAIYSTFPLIILINVSRNSYFMYNNEIELQTKISPSGSYRELTNFIAANEVHPEDKNSFDEFTDFSYLEKKSSKKIKEGIQKTLIYRQLNKNNEYQKTESIAYYAGIHYGSDRIVVFLSRFIQ